MLLHKCTTLRGSEGATPKFCNFKALKWLKIDPKYMKDVKTNNVNLYYNFSPKKIFQ